MYSYVQAKIYVVIDTYRVNEFQIWHFLYDNTELSNLIVNKCVFFALTFDRVAYQIKK